MKKPPPGPPQKLLTKVEYVPGREKNQKTVEYPGLLSYIIGMINTTCFPIRVDAFKNGRLL